MNNIYFNQQTQTKELFTGDCGDNYSYSVHVEKMTYSKRREAKPALLWKLKDAFFIYMNNTQLLRKYIIIKRGL